MWPDAHGDKAVTEASALVEEVHTVYCRHDKNASWIIQLIVEEIKMDADRNNC